MNRFNNLIRLIICHTLCSTALLCGFTHSVAAEFELRFANVTNQPSVLAAEEFMAAADKFSAGRLKITHFPNNELGDDRSAIEALMLGEIDIVQCPPTVLSHLVTDLYVFDAPYLFDRTEDVWRCMDGTVGQEINRQTEQFGARYLVSVENGYRHLTNSLRAVRQPSDLAGIKIRVMENELQLAMWTAWGARPFPTSFPELVTSLKNRTIDAEENSLSIIDSNRFFETQHYITLTGHMFSPHNLYINKDRYNSLPNDLREAFDKAVTVYRDTQRRLAEELNAKSVAKFREAGCEVIELTQPERESWRKQAQEKGIYDMVKSRMQHPEYLDRILKGDY